MLPNELLDDIFADLQTDPTARLATLDQLDHVIYVGGFSKTVSASLPVGYLIAKRELVHDLTNVKMLTSVGGSRFAEAVVSTLLERGAYRKYVERLRQRAGLTRYGEEEMLAVLRKAGFSGERARLNIGHNQARMAFLARPR